MSATKEMHSSTLVQGKLLNHQNLPKDNKEYQELFSTNIDSGVSTRYTSGAVSGLNSAAKFGISDSYCTPLPQSNQEKNGVPDFNQSNLLALLNNLNSPSTVRRDKLGNEICIEEDEDIDDEDYKEEDSDSDDDFEPLLIRTTSAPAVYDSFKRQCHIEDEFFDVEELEEMLPAIVGGSEEILEVGISSHIKASNETSSSLFKNISEENTTEDYSDTSLDQSEELICPPVPPKIEYSPSPSIAMLNTTIDTESYMSFLTKTKAFVEEWTCNIVAEERRQAIAESVNSLQASSKDESDLTADSDVTTKICDLGKHTKEIDGVTYNIHSQAYLDKQMIISHSRYVHHVSGKCQPCFYFHRGSCQGPICGGNKCHFCTLTRKKSYDIHRRIVNSSKKREYIDTTENVHQLIKPVVIDEDQLAFTLLLSMGMQEWIWKNYGYMHLVMKNKALNVETYNQLNSLNQSSYYSGPNCVLRELDEEKEKGKAMNGHNPHGGQALGYFKTQNIS